MNSKAFYRKTSKSFAILAALLAVLAGVFGISDVTGATDVTKMVETWRVVGLFTFGALFLLLATRATQNLRLWEIVLANKAILTLIGLMYGSKVQGAQEAAMWDLILTAVLLVGYIFARKMGQPKSA